MSREILTRPPLPAEGRIPYGPDPNQFFDFWNRGGSAKRLTVMIHGGFWRSAFDLSHATHLCTALADADTTVVSLEYRRAGITGGGWPQTFDDIVRAIRAVKAEFGLAAKLIVLGHSAGGHLALRLACENEGVGAVVGLGPVTCLDLAWSAHLGNGAVVEFLGGTPESIPDVYRAADPSRQSAVIPRLIMHGTLDDVVPLTHSHTFASRRVDDNPPPYVLDVEHADHFDVIDPQSQAWTLVRDHIRAMSDHYS